MLFLWLKKKCQNGQWPPGVFTWSNLALFEKMWTPLTKAIDLVTTTFSFLHKVPSKTDCVMCFGPVSPSGYGVCYNPMDDHINFAVSSFNSCSETNAAHLARAVEAALQDMRKLLEQTPRAKLWNWTLITSVKWNGSVALMSLFDRKSTLCVIEWLTEPLAGRPRYSILLIWLIMHFK